MGIWGHRKKWLCPAVGRKGQAIPRDKAGSEQQCGQRGLCEGKRPAGGSPQTSWDCPGKWAPESGCLGQETPSRERRVPREARREGDSREEVCFPSLPPRGHWGQVFRTPRPSERAEPRREGCGWPGEQKGVRSGLPPRPARPRGGRAAGPLLPPPPAGAEPRRSPAAARTAAGARGAGPAGENQTRLAASQPIREQTGLLRPMAAADANER